MQPQSTVQKPTQSQSIQPRNPSPTQSPKTTTSSKQSQPAQQPPTTPNPAMSEMMMAAAAAAVANQNPSAMEQYFESLKMKQLAEVGMQQQKIPQGNSNISTNVFAHNQPKITSSSSAQKHSKKRKL